MLPLSSQSQLLGSNPVVWLCDQDPVRTFQKGPPPDKAKLRHWWTYLSQLRLSVHHIQGVKKECAHQTSLGVYRAITPRYWFSYLPGYYRGGVAKSCEA